MMELYHKYIEINPTKMLGKPVIKGTRITVEMIVGETKAGYTLNDILKAHPHLRTEAVQAALNYADAYMKNAKNKSK